MASNRKEAILTWRRRRGIAGVSKKRKSMLLTNTRQRDGRRSTPFSGGRVTGGVPQLPISRLIDQGERWARPYERICTNNL